MQKPRVVLGLFNFGPPGTEFHGSRITSMEDFKACLDHFEQHGHSEIDTARIYVNGLQESWTREAGWKDRGLSIATKWYPTQPGDHAAAEVRKQLEKSLAELGTNRVDIFYLHAPDRTVPFEETLSALNDLHKEGKFVRLGLSNYSAWEVAEICTLARCRDWVQPTVYQLMYNALTRPAEEELIPCCRRFGIQIIAYNPLGGGILSGKYSDTRAQDEGRFSDIDPRVGKMYRDRYFKDENFAALQLILPVVEKHGLTCPQVAFRWMVHHSRLNVLDGADGIVIGISSLEQLRKNLSWLDEGPLPQDLFEILDQAWEKHTRLCSPLYWR